VSVVESPVPTSGRAGPDDDVALRDATAIADRVRADEAAADAARARYAVEPLLPIAAPSNVARYLQTHERLLVVRTSVLIELPLEGPGAGRQMRGDLCLTDRRLLVVDDRLVATVDLGDIVEIGVVGDRTMQLSTSTGRGLAIDLDRPRLFRVEIRAAGDRLAFADGTGRQVESR
jgi:hypothetical protein